MSQWYLLFLTSHIAAATITAGFMAYGLRGMFKRQIQSLNRAAQGIAIGTVAAVISGIGLSLSVANSSIAALCRNIALYVTLCLVSELGLYVAKQRINRHGNQTSFARD